MAEQDDREAGVLPAGLLVECLQIGDDVLEVLDESALTRALAVTDVVDGVDDSAVSHQGVGHALVSADMLAVAVCDDDDVGRLVGAAP